MHHFKKKYKKKKVQKFCIYRPKISALWHCPESELANLQLQVHAPYCRQSWTWMAHALVPKSIWTELLLPASMALWYTKSLKCTDVTFIHNPMISHWSGGIWMGNRECRADYMSSMYTWDLKGRHHKGITWVERLIWRKFQNTNDIKWQQNNLPTYLVCSRNKISNWNSCWSGGSREWWDKTKQSMKQFLSKITATIRGYKYVHKWLRVPVV